MAPVLDMRTKAEYVDPQERISGNATVGVIFYKPGDTVQLDGAFAFFSEPVNGPLEMQLATVDGRYLATFDYSSNKPHEGWVRLNLSLSNPGFLSAYESDEVALILTNATTRDIYPIRWGATEEGDYVRVHVNAEGAHSYFAVKDPTTGKRSARNCRQASRRSSFKFDRICDVPIADAAAANRIDIVRKRGAGFGTPITINVKVED